MATMKAKEKEPDPKDSQRQGSSSTVTKQKKTCLTVMESKHEQVFTFFFNTEASDRFDKSIHFKRTTAADIWFFNLLKYSKLTELVVHT